MDGMGGCGEWVDEWMGGCDRCMDVMDGCGGCDGCDGCVGQTNTLSPILIPILCHFCCVV